jgi:hypothetical protein
MVRIESDGTPFGTKVHDENGNELQGITNVEFSHRAGKEPNVIVRLFSDAKLRGAGVFMVADPNDGGKVKEVSRIEFADGSKFVPK